MSRVRVETFQHMRKITTNLQANEELAAAAAAVGVDAAMLGRGRALLERAELKDQQHQRLTKDVKITAAALKSTRKELWALYRLQRRMAQLVVTDTTIRTLLDLDGDLEKANAMRLEQCRSFYTAALNSPEMLAALALAGLMQPQLEAGLTLVTQLDGLITSEISLRATKEQATADLLNLMRQVRAWMHATTTLVRFGAAAHPQLLKAISHEVRRGKRGDAEDDEDEGGDEEE